MRAAIKASIEGGSTRETKQSSCQQAAKEGVSNGWQHQHHERQVQFL